MPHAYVATPPVEPPSSTPIGWDPNWPWWPEAPEPPGYVPPAPGEPGSIIDDSDEPLTPLYRARVTMTINYAGSIDGFDTELEMSSHAGSIESPFEQRVPWSLSNNFAVVGNYAGYILESEVISGGPHFSAGGVVGVSSYVEHKQMVLGQSYLVYLFLRDQSGGYQITLTIEAFRTPFVPDGIGGFVEGVEVPIGSSTETGTVQKVQSDTGGHGSSYPGWLVIQRVPSGGIIIEQQWTELGPSGPIPIQPDYGHPDRGEGIGWPYITHRNL